MDDPFSFLDIDSRLSGRVVFFLFSFSLSVVVFPSCCEHGFLFLFLSKNKRVFESKTTTQQIPFLFLILLDNRILTMVHWPVFIVIIIVFKH